MTIKKNKPLVWVEIDKASLSNNINTFRSIIGKETLLAPCVKANAFGHGLIETSKIFLEAGANWLCVNSIEEAELLRKANITAPILLIGYVQLSELYKIFDLDLRLFIYNIQTVQKLSQLSKDYKKNCNVHMKIDTGMGRQGILVNECEEFLHNVLSLDGINVEGIATHFATADEKLNNAIFKHQLKLFLEFAERMKKKYNRDFILHCSNSSATLMYPEAKFDLVRPGISVYGYYPNGDIEKLCKERGLLLKPAFSLKTKVVQVKILPANYGISYGSTYITKKETKVCLIPIGYNEGISRSLSNKGFVSLKGKKANILGRVSMHMTVIDGSAISNVKLEDELSVIDKVSIEKFASLLNTNINEILVSIPSEIPRLII